MSHQLTKVDSPTQTYLKQALHRMFVYGIRCAPADLMAIYERIPQGSAAADYYMDYGLLIFPEYTRPSFIQAHAGLTDTFWNRVRRVVEAPNRPHTVELEHPWISDSQSHVVRIIKDAYPSTDTDWYYVPAVAAATPSTRG